MLLVEWQAGRISVFSSQFSVRSFQLAVFSSQFSVRSFQFAVFSSQFSVVIFQPQVSDEFLAFQMA